MAIAPNDIEVFDLSVANVAAFKTFLVSEEDGIEVRVEVTAPIDMPPERGGATELSLTFD